MAKKANWHFSLPYSLVLMVPFDLLASLAMDVFLPAIPKITETYAASSNIVQLTLTAYMLMLGIGQLIFGPLSDRYGRRPILLGGAFLFSVSSLSIILAPNIAVFIILRIFQGAGASAVLVATFATVRDVYGNKKESTTIYALLSGLLASVPALGPLIGAALMTWINWQAIFLCLSILAFIAGVHASLRWPETRRSGLSNKPFKLAFMQIISSSRFWLFSAAFAVAMGSFFVYFSIAPYLLMRGLGYTPMVFSVLFSSVAIIMIITSRYVADIAETLGINRMLKIGMIFILLGGIILGLNAHFLVMSAITFLYPVAIIAVGISFTTSVTANGALSEFPDIAGAAVAFYYCIETLIVCILGTLAVAIYSQGTVWPLVFFSTLGSTVILISFVLY